VFENEDFWFCQQKDKHLVSGKPQYTVNLLAEVDEIA
jgi:hypothetical protein